MLHPQAQRFLADLEATGAPPMTSVTPQTARAMHAGLVRALAGPPVPVDDVRERELPGPAGPIPTRIYTPDVGPGAPVFVYFHGGGFVLGDLAMADEVCRLIANDAGCIVVSVDYRLAPEHPFPGPVTDAFAATQWVGEHAAEIGGDPKRIAVGGDSAGGNLAAVVALMARDRGAPALAMQILVYPAADPSDDLPSLRTFGNGHYLTLETMQWFGRHHTANAGHRDDPYLWPILAASVRGLPPALVITAEADPIRDGGERYAQRLQNEGVPTQLIRYDGMLHGFFMYPSVFDRGRDAVRDAAAALRAAFAPETPL